MPYKSDHIKVLKVFGSELPKRPSMKTTDIVAKAFKNADDGDRKVRNAYRMIRKNEHIEIGERGEYKMTQAGAAWFAKAEKEGFKAPEKAPKAPKKADKAPKKAKPTQKAKAAPKAAPKAPQKAKPAAKAAAKPAAKAAAKPAAKPAAKAAAKPAAKAAVKKPVKTGKMPSIKKAAPKAEAKPEGKNGVGQVVNETKPAADSATLTF